MKNYSNKGMLLESIIINSGEYLKDNKICLIFKRNLPIKVCHVDGNDIKGKIYSKSFSDFYALYRGFFFDFEAKQTEDDVFKLSNIKTHQLNHLELINEFNGFSFLLVYFIKYDTYLAIEYDDLSKIKHQNSIKYDDLTKISFKLDFKFPGILRFDQYFDFLLNKKALYENN